MLGDTEYKTISAYDSNEALSRLEEDNPVLIVTDSLVFMDIALTITGTEGAYSGCIGSIPVIIAGDFFLQVVLVQTFLANKASDISQIKFTCESRGT